MFGDFEFIVIVCLNLISLNIENRCFDREILKKTTAKKTNVKELHPDPGCLAGKRLKSPLNAAVSRTVPVRKVPDIKVFEESRV